MCYELLIRADRDGGADVAVTAAVRAAEFEDLAEDQDCGQCPHSRGGDEQIPVHPPTVDHLRPA